MTVIRIDYTNITLDIACRAVEAYNSGCYAGGIKNPDLDRRARELFASGLAQSLADIQDQVHFIGVDYGGTAGFKAAYSLAPAIARDIYAIRDRYATIAESAPPLVQLPSPIEVITELFAPFVKPLHSKNNWQVWATKFWHFLNPEAFPIEDSRVDNFFRIFARANSPDKYVFLCCRFRKFVMVHQHWITPLREVDGGRAWCDNKLWDKVCYGLGELK
jgi:hypothetical protein